MLQTSAEAPRPLGSLLTPDAAAPAHPRQMVRAHAGREVAFFFLMILIFDEVCALFGQELSTSKTKWMKCKGRADAFTPRRNDVIQVRGVTIEEVRSFTYLGVKENDSASMDDEIVARILKMERAFHSKKGQLYANKDLKLRTRLQGFNAIITSTATYCSGCWNVTPKQIRRIEGSYFRLLRWTVGGFWDGITNTSYELLIKTALDQGCVILPIEAHIRRHQLRFAAHVERMGKASIPRMVIRGGTPDRGMAWRAPRSGLSSSLRGALKSFGIEPAQWQVRTRKTGKKDMSDFLRSDGVLLFMKRWLAKRVERHNKAKAKSEAKARVAADLRSGAGAGGDPGRGAGEGGGEGEEDEEPSSDEDAPAGHEAANLFASADVDSSDQEGGPEEEQEEEVGAEVEEGVAGHPPGEAGRAALRATSIVDQLGRWLGQTGIAEEGRERKGKKSSTRAKKNARRRRNTTKGGGGEGGRPDDTAEKGSSAEAGPERTTTAATGEGMAATPGKQDGGKGEMEAAGDNSPTTDQGTVTKRAKGSSKGRTERNRKRLAAFHATRTTTEEAVEQDQNVGSHTAAAELEGGEGW